MAGGETLTYGELDRLAAAYARRLAAMGVGPGDRVATTLPAGIPLAALLHATGRLGAALAPLDPRAPAPEHDRQMSLARAELLVADPLEGAEAAVAPDRGFLDPRAVRTVLFTSGSTAEPKPVELTNANHAASARASAAVLGRDPADRWLCALPLFHVGGLSILLRAAAEGATVVLHERFEPDRVAAGLADGGTTLISLVPTMLQRLRAAGFERAPALRVLLLGGGPIPEELLAWGLGRGLPVAPTYGMTETASQVATLPPADARAGRRGARPLEGVQIRVDGEGEILLRGPMVSAGALAGDGWLHTGDLGSLDEDGYLHVTGRAADVIVTGGENVSAAEVEAALTDHPAVADAAVVGRPDPEWGEAVTAFVVLSGRARPDELAAHCRARLAPAKVPKRIEVVADLPRSAAGKLLRSRLAP